MNDRDIKTVAKAAVTNIDAHMNDGENNLEELRCPKCGKNDMFKIVVFCEITVKREGIAEINLYEWDDTSPCGCSCGFSGRWADLKGIKR